MTVPYAEVALLAAAALHAGFQLTVTAVVYPALARVPGAQWRVAHDAHSRAIVPLVVLTYGALLAGGAWVLTSAPSLWTVLSLGSAGLSVLATALVAAPTHGRLAGGPTPDLLRRLLRADRVRAVGALGCLVAAGAAVLT